MPGERLMCVWQAVHSKDVFPESGVKRATVMSVTENFSSLNHVRYTEARFQEVFTDSKVDFSKYRDYVYQWLQAPGVPSHLLLDSLERKCWEMAGPIYESEALNVAEIEKMWYIFNRLALAGSYPPRASAAEMNWIFDMVAKNIGKTWVSQSSIAAEGFTFQEMIATLDKTFFSVTSTIAVRECITDLHDWLVREVMKAGWLQKRTRKNANWTNWQKRWFVMTPGKLLYYGSEKESKKTLKGQVVMDRNTIAESLEAFKSVFTKMENRFRVKTTPQFEIEMNTESSVEKKDWMKQLFTNIEAMKTGVTPVTRLLKSRSEATTTTPKEHDNELEERRKITRAATKKMKAPSVDDNIEPRKAAPKVRAAPPNLPTPVEDEDEAYDNNADAVQKDKIQTVFYQIDQNGNGKIDPGEFYDFIKGLGANVNRRETDLIFTTIDKDKNGSICFNEFYDFFVKLIMGQVGDTAAEAQLRAAFLKADRDGSGAVNFREFAEYAWSKRRSYAVSKLLVAFDEMDEEGKGEIGFTEFQKFFAAQTSIPGDTGEEGKEGLESYLKGFYEQADAKEMAQFLRKRWDKFASFRRYGAEGEVVMKGGHGMVADVVPGQYDLLDLACFNDLPPIIPKHITVKVTWSKSSVPGKSGRCIFPPDFDGVLPVDIATNGHLAYYGASLADGQQLQVSLLYRHGIQDFTYENTYLSDYVTNESAMGGAGIEKHEFSHLDCPLEEDSGYFVMGKLTENGELHLSGFKVPTRHTLYLPSGVIHSNDYLKGTWRTMLSDETEIDHVQMVRHRRKGNVEEQEHFTFKFQ